METELTTPVAAARDPQTYALIGAAIEVHRAFGPGFLEAVYQDALEIELQLNAIPYEREKHLPVSYKGNVLPHPYRADFVCYEDIVVETKAQNALTSVDEAQLLHYLKCSGMRRGLLLNFGAVSLEKKRLVFG